MKALVAHYHEIGLKGRNRNFFEDALARNLRRALRGTGYGRLRQAFGRVVVDLPDGALVDEALDRASRVFGVAYVAAGVRVPPDLGAIRTTALELAAAAPFRSFAVRARRTYSRYPETSQKINVAIGQAVKDATGARVDLSHPETTFWIELFGTGGVVYTQRLEGPGGLPAGVSGRLLALLSGGIDSPVAAWRMARRGADVELVHFHGRPYTDPSSSRQAADLADALCRYQLRTTLHLVPLGEAQREIVMNSPSDLRVVLYRRAMMRIAAALAREREAAGLVTGDALGQVASQTIQNIKTVDDAVPGTQVLRPLVGSDKQEIVELAKKIGTYEISTRKYQDCCVLFEPRSPATRAYPSIASAAEQGLDMDAIVGKALAGVETRHVELPDPAPATQSGD